MPQTDYTLPAVAAGTPLTVELDVVAAHGAEGFALGEAKLVSRTAQAAQGATNFATLNIQYVRAGAAPVVLASLNLGTVALVQDIPVEFTYVLQDRANMQSGDVIQIAAVHTGTGGVLAAGAVMTIERE
jgi:hypothetical protein